MKRVLYIGNNLKSKTSNPTGVQVLGPLLEKEGYAVFYASSRSNKVIRLMDMVKSCLVYSKKVDVVLIDTYSTQNFYYAFVVSQLCRILKLTYIPILHGGNLPKRLMSNPKMCHKIFDYAKYNVSPSLYLKNEFEKLGYTNIVHIPNTLETKNYPVLTKQYEVPKLLWVRSFSRIYNPQLAIKSLKLLKTKFPNAELCMVGPDSDGTLKAVKKLADTLKVEVRLTGKLSKKQWIELSKDYNIFINTTNFDNMPVSVIEAMSLGLPIVSTNVGGLPFLLDHFKTAMLVEPNNSEQMVEAIIEVMTNKNLRDVMIDNAREKAMTFDWNSIKHKWLETLTK